MTDSIAELAARITALEDRESIKALKARYCRSLDLRDVESLRETLLAEAIIAYEGFPRFESRDAFIEVFQQMGCAPGVYDIHHALNAQIELTGANSAIGKWSLHFKSVIVPQSTVITMGVEYTDRYVKRDDRWWIAETRTTRPLCLIEQVDDEGRATYSALGPAPETYG